MAYVVRETGVSSNGGTKLISSLDWRRWGGDKQECERDGMINDSMTGKRGIKLKNRRVEVVPILR